MGLPMYCSVSPLPTTVGKPDPTAAARSPIRRTASHSRSHSARSQRRPNANAESLFLSSQSSPQPTADDAAVESPGIPGNQSAAATLIEIATNPEIPSEAIPFVFHTSAIARGSASQTTQESARNGSVPSSDTTRRMQVTRQRPAQRASPEADMGRFVVRPILSDDETGAEATRPSTVDPMELLVPPSEASADAIYQRYRRFFLAAGRRSQEIMHSEERARSRSPRRRATAPRIAPLDPTDGLGDRRRSPSAEVEENDWETLRATIQPDAQLPSASSSFTSASASSSPFDAQTASAPSSATTSAASFSFRTNRRYVLPTSQCLDITVAQRECGVVCDAAHDAHPPFPPSRGPSRPTTREPSADRPRTRRRRSPPVAGAAETQPTSAEENIDHHPPLRLHDSFMVDSLQELEAQAAREAAEADDQAEAEAEADSLVLTRLRLPDTDGVGLGPFITTASSAASPSPSDLQSPPPALTADGEHNSSSSSSSNNNNNAVAVAAAAVTAANPRLGQRIAEAQIHQLRRINELLRFGREVPGWLWEVAGLAPELSVREFEI